MKKRFIFIPVICILLALSVSFVSIAAETDLVELTLSDFSCGVAYFADSSYSSVITTQTRHGRNMSFVVDSNLGPYFTVNYTASLPSNFSWQTDVAYLVTFDVYIGVSYNGLEVSDYPPFSVGFNDRDFYISNLPYIFYSVAQYARPFIQCSTFESQESSEPYHSGSIYGKHQTLSFLFKFSGTVSYMSGKRYLCMVSSSPVLYNDTNTHPAYWFGSFNMSGLSDPSGDLSIEDASVQDVINSQLAAAAQAHQDAVDLQNTLDSGFAGIEGAINGDGSYGSPESQYGDDFDNYEAAESDYLDQVGVDSYLNDDYVDDMFVELGWDQIDVPDRNSAGIFHSTVNPLFQYFPVFIVFPCFLGLIATILGRRKT